MATDQLIPRYYYGASEDRDYLGHMNQIAQTIESAVSSSASRQIAATTSAAELASDKIAGAIHGQGANLVEGQREIAWNITGLARMQSHGLTGLADQGRQTQELLSSGISGLADQGRQTQEFLSLGFQAMSRKFGAIQYEFVQGLGRMNDTLIRGFRDVCGVLDKINDNLSNPFLVQSRELYRRALLNYSKGFYEEAVEDLIKAIEINKTDYMSWFLLGKVYLDGAGEFSCVIDLDAAIRAFVNAAKYIKPDIAGHGLARQTAAEILFYLGLARQTKAKDSAFKNKTKEDARLAEDARRAYDQSWACSNEMLEALYNSARYDVILDDRKAALNKLQTVIWKAPGYGEEVMRDPDFVPLYGDIPRMLDSMREKFYPQAKKIALELSRLKQELESQYGSLPFGLVAILDKVPNEKELETSSYIDLHNMVERRLRVRKEIYDFLWKAFDLVADTTGKGVTIAEYINTEEPHIVIPQTYRGNPVTGIGESAFWGCSGLTSVSIPQGVTSIGESAFSGCSGLTSVSIPQGVTSIGDWAFYGCSGLTSVSIPQGVTSIGKMVFFGCSSLSNECCETIRKKWGYNLFGSSLNQVGNSRSNPAASR